jgi:ElaB/YqjD/DUF883 family membrane-anchored ribosome-binding protein
MHNYEYPTLSYANDLNRIKIPKFQRSLVWNKKKKQDLIITLHKGFPFGALLVAPMPTNQEELRLLDGQQRLATINDYAENTVEYWCELNKDKAEKVLTKINNLLMSFDKSIELKDLYKYLDSSFDLADWTDQYINLDPEVKKNLRTIIQDTRKEIKGYINLDNLQIPVIKFLGKDSDLPEVFENLNKGGVPLTKYEVFSAAWDSDSIKLPFDDENSDSILTNVKEYYTDLARNGEFEFDDFSEDDLTESRTINLAEFGRALGKFVVERIPSLVGESDKSAMNELGFGLLGIISDTPNKEIASVNQKVSQFQRDMTDNLKRIDRIANELNNKFDKLLRQNISFDDKPKTPKSKFSTGLTTSFKILSYFAALWDLDEKDLQQSLNNIPAYYVFDALNSTWTSHGDQRLQDYYPSVASKNYLNALSEESFRRIFDTWLDENNGMRKTFANDTKALITIHSNLTYFAGRIPRSESYEFEHIVPKARVISVDKKVDHVRLSSLGNGMFLPKSLNAKKQTKTLYEYINADTKDDVIKENPEYNDYIVNSDYPDSSKLSRALSDLQNYKFDLANQIINNRSKNVEQAIIDGLL